jgi:hypothetical protein
VDPCRICLSRVRQPKWRDIARAGRLIIVKQGC